MQSLRSMQHLQTAILLAGLSIMLYLPAIAQLKPDNKQFKPFIWKSETPADCHFEQSSLFTNIKFLGSKTSQKIEFINSHDQNK